MVTWGCRGGVEGLSQTHAQVPRNQGTERGGGTLWGNFLSGLASFKGKKVVYIQRLIRLNWNTAYLCSVRVTELLAFPVMCLRAGG